MRSSSAAARASSGSCSNSSRDIACPSTNGTVTIPIGVGWSIRPAVRASCSSSRSTRFRSDCTSLMAASLRSSYASLSKERGSSCRIAPINSSASRANSSPRPEGSRSAIGRLASSKLNTKAQSSGGVARGSRFHPRQHGRAPSGARGAGDEDVIAGLVDAAAEVDRRQCPNPARSPRASGPTWPWSRTAAAPDSTLARSLSGVSSWSWTTLGSSSECGLRIEKRPHRLVLPHPPDRLLPPGPLLSAVSPKKQGASSK